MSFSYITTILTERLKMISILMDIVVKEEHKANSYIRREKERERPYTHRKASFTSTTETHT